MKKSKKRSLMTSAALLILILILPFNIIGIITSYMSYRSSIDNAEDVISYTLNSYSSILNTRISNCNHILYNVYFDNAEFSTMCDNTSSSMYEIYANAYFQDMNDQLENMDSADYVFVYLPANKDYIQSPASTGFTIGTCPFIDYAETYSYSYANWFITGDDCYLLRVSYSNRYNAYCGVVINLEDFLGELGDFDGYPSIQYRFTSEPLKETAQKHVFNSQVMDNLYLSASIDYRDLFGHINALIFIFIIFFIAYLALIPVLILLMRRYVAIPLIQLNQAQGQIENGNEDYRIDFPAASREFETAYHSFNDMAESIQTLHADVLEKELSNKQLQIDYLQLQIRPHFLLNAFNVLYTLIQKEEKKPAQDMVLFLSDYFRYLFRSGHELQLFSKERKLIEDYLRVSRIYYPISFEVSYQLDPVLDMLRVPPLLLHSFIENIIAHALLPDRPVHIVFSGEYADGLVTFYISDDGKGMTAENVEAINHAAERPIDDGQNVGIKNSIRRLHHYYGDSASVLCESELDYGTTFTITIPYNLEEDE